MLITVATVLTIVIALIEILIGTNEALFAFMSCCFFLFSSAQSERISICLFLLSINISALFYLQYLGLVEVEESRGMHVCEDAVKKLKVVSIPHTHEACVCVCV